MKERKDFDCVAMKGEIQQRLLQEEGEFGTEEARRRRRDRILADPILGPLLRKARVTNPSATVKVA